jgi:hypothetical protein
MKMSGIRRLAKFTGNLETTEPFTVPCIILKGSQVDSILALLQRLGYLSRWRKGTLKWYMAQEIWKLYLLIVRNNSGKTKSYLGYFSLSFTYIVTQTGFLSCHPFSSYLFSLS